MARRSLGLPKLSRRQRVGRYAGRRAAGVLLAFLAALAVFAADRLGLFGRQAPRAATGPDAERYHGKSFRTVHVVDGDTLDLDVPDGIHDRTRIRLWGVDTPETVHPGKPPQHFGPQATEFTRRACEGQTVTLELAADKARDRYGRLLAYVILPDGRMLNRELVRLGYGFADPRYPNPRRQEFLSLQEAAKAQRLGLWREVRPADLPYYLREGAAAPR